MSTSNPATAASAEGVASAALKLRYLVVAVLGVWILSIPCAEIIFRLLGERTTTDLVGLYQSFGRNGGYKLSPNVRADADTLVGRFSVLTNDLGLRCGKEDLRRRSGAGNRTFSSWAIRRPTEKASITRTPWWGNWLPWPSSGGWL